MCHKPHIVPLVSVEQSTMTMTTTTTTFFHYAKHSMRLTWFLLRISAQQQIMKNEIIVCRICCGQCILNMLVARAIAMHRNTKLTMPLSKRYDARIQILSASNKIQAKRKKKKKGTNAHILNDWNVLPHLMNALVSCSISVECLLLVSYGRIVEMFSIFTATVKKKICRYTFFSVKQRETIWRKCANVRYLKRKKKKKIKILFNSWPTTIEWTATLFSDRFKFLDSIWKSSCTIN